MKVLETSKASIHDTTLEGFRKRMIFNHRKYRPSDTWYEIRSSGNSELYLEEMRRFNQANLARRVKIITTGRLLGKGCYGFDKQDDAEKPLSLAELQLENENSKTVQVPMCKRFFADYSGPDKRTLTSVKLQLENENSKTIKLTNVTILPMVGRQGGKTVIGTLEAHVNGFRYTTSNEHFQIDIISDNVKDAFFRVEDERMPPLVHFHLYHHIMVGAEKTKDIQFQLVMNLVGCKRSADGDSKAFQDFIQKVDAKWRSQPISHLRFVSLDKKCQFRGVHCSATSAVFVLTMFSLVGIAETPFVVVRLREVEIVNLAQLRPGEVDMTVVFKDFKRPVVQINSIPLDSLAAIKARLNAVNVKFYVNQRDINWASVLEGITKSPETFIKNGAWDFFDLEDSDTSGYYSDDSHFEEGDMDEIA